MTGAFSLLVFPILVFFVWFAEPFGPVPMTLATTAGVVFCLMASVPLLRARATPYRIVIRRPLWLQVLIVGLVPLVPLWLYYIVNRFGLPPAFYALLGGEAPADILNGKYRDPLPLKSVFPPFMIAMTVVSMLLTLIRRRIALTILVLVISFSFVSVYDTRHVILWVIIYVFLSFFYFTGSLVDQFRAVSVRVWLGILLLMIGGWWAFVALGNIRTTMNSDTSERFAVAMGLYPPYTRLPLTAVWGVIYLCAGVARGMVQENVSTGLEMNIPAKALPGILQPAWARDVFPDDQFATPSFTINGWHSYVLWFGFTGACLFTIFIFCLLHLTSRSFEKRLAAGRAVIGVRAAFVLWLWVRVALLPIADYFVDLGGIMELFFLCLLFHVGGIGFEPLKLLKARARSSDESAQRESAGVGDRPEGPETKEGELLRGRNVVGREL